MKSTLMALGGAAALGATGAAFGSQDRSSVTIQLHPGGAFIYAGVTCTAYPGTTATNADLVCVRNDLRGYGVIMSQDQILIAKKVNGKIVVAFRKPNT